MQLRTHTHTQQIYAGQADYICNWYGNRAWTLNLPWQGKEGFEKAGEHTWSVNGKDAGIARNFGPLTFVGVKDAGHMVCALFLPHTLVC